MSEREALQGFLDKWRAQWPEWAVAEVFVPEAQRECVQAWLALREPLADLAARYGSNFALQGLPPLPALAVLATAGVLGWLGAGLVTGHYLRQARPREH